MGLLADLQSTLCVSVTGLQFSTWHFPDQLAQWSGGASKWRLCGVPEGMHPLRALHYRHGYLAVGSNGDEREVIIGTDDCTVHNCLQSHLTCEQR